MGAKQEAQDWTDIVRRYAERHEVTYEPVGGINPKDAPVALCVGGFFDKAVLPTALIAKAHMPDLAQVVPAFNVESIEGTEHVQQRFSRKVEFESLDFNKRFWTTVPKDFDPVALRELFGPGFLAWVTTMTGEISFGVNDRQLWFLWRLGERSEEELKAALKNAGQLFRRIQSEMEESGIHTYPPGPWPAGLAPFPDAKAPDGSPLVPS